jgi:putative Mg2+ transporter-C (MgtC) family protein
MSLLAVLAHHVSDGDVALRLGLAVLLGGLIGLEREVSDQPAGLRTHITVALGAALFGVISVHGFDAYVRVRADTNYQIDVTRVASQVVVGVGFLGAGAIMKDGASIRGLTTAASLWVTSAVGLAVGVGSLVAGSMTTLALIVALVGLRGPRRWARARLGATRTLALVRLQAGAEPADVVSALRDLRGVEVRNLSVRHREDGDVVEVDMKLARGARPEEMLRAITEREDVAGIEVT